MLSATDARKPGRRRAAVGLLVADLLLSGLLAGLTVSESCRFALAADDGAKKSAAANLAMRPYSDGPLSAADFRCPPPNPLPQKNGVYLSAMTYTSLNYTTRYRWRDDPSGKIEARLTAFQIVAQVDRRASWTTRPTDERLLDHEQGHFDVTEMWARRIQKKFNDLISRGAIAGRGGDSDAAVADMNRQVDSHLQRMLDDEHKSQDQYDIATRHGTNRKSQADERQKQIAALRGKAVPAKKAEAEGND